LDGVKFVDVLRIIAGFICLVLIIVYAYLAFKAKEKDNGGDNSEQE
jgi:glucose uptake protein GlcU